MLNVRIDGDKEEIMMNIQGTVPTLTADIVTMIHGIWMMMNEKNKREAALFQKCLMLSMSMAFVADPPEDVPRSDFYDWYKAEFDNSDHE